MEKSALQIARAAYQPKLPKALQGAVKIKEGQPTQSVGDQEAIKKLFPNTYGMPIVEFEPATSANNQKMNVESVIDEYRNTGGFDMIGSGRTKLEKVEQFEKGLEIIRQLDIKAIVIIGGDDSNTNACVLAEYYAAQKYGVQVIGCPKTIDGDLKNDQIETSFGFDTACKTYSELIGNIERDCNSARKYWHFIKVMGRQKAMSLDDIVEYIANAVAARAADGNNFGTVIIPEGVIEFIPAIKKLIAQLNDVLALPEVKDMGRTETIDFAKAHLTEENLAVFNSLPTGVARQLALDRDPHGNVQVSLIETEKLLSTMVAQKLEKLKKEGKYTGKFGTQHHFFGYEGRCAAPSNFDADYCYALGTSAAQLIANGKTGYMAIVKNTTAPAEQWIAGGVPITMMMNPRRARRCSLQGVCRTSRRVGS